MTGFPVCGKLTEFMKFGREKAGFYLKAETSLLVNVAANG